MAGRGSALLLVLLTLLLVGSGPVGGVAMAGVTTEVVEAPLDPAASPITPPDVDRTTTRIRVYPNGSAVWTAEIRTRITNETDRQDYRQFQSTFRQNTDRYLDPYRQRMVGLVAKAANVTDREMATRNFAASTRIQNTPRQWGVVEYRFRWEGFAESRDGEVLIGDVFESGYYLTRGDLLIIETAGGLRIESATPTPDREEATAVRWVGPIDFADRRPSVRAVRAVVTATATSETPTVGEGTTGPGSGTTVDDADQTPANGPATPGEPNRENGTTSSSRAPGTTPGPGMLATVAGGVVLVLLGVGGYVVVSKRNGTRADETPDDPIDDGDGGGDGPEGATADPGPSTGELVTDEELVIDLLESNGGRMRQADIAEELDWSASKTSRLLSDMAEDGAIEKLRLGNENIIDLLEEE